MSFLVGLFLIVRLILALCILAWFAFVAIVLIRCIAQIVKCKQKTEVDYKKHEGSRL